MAAPTEAEVQSQISKAVSIYIALRNFGSVNATNYVDLEDALVQALESDYSDQVLGALRGVRAGLGTIIAQMRAVLDPLWLAYGKVKSFPEQTPEGIIARLYRDMVDNSKTVNSREFTFGSPSADGGNDGDGVLNRLTADADGYDIENMTPEARTVRCISDARSGTQEHEEEFEIRGGTPDRDGIAVTASGRPGTLKAVSAKTSAENQLQNPSFTAYSGSIGTLTDLTGWTVTSGVFTKIALVEGAANTYRGYPGEGDTPRALKFTDNDSVYQNLTDRNFQNPLVAGVYAPMYLQVGWNREIGSGADATITLTLGSQTASVAVASLAGWQILRIALGTKNWLRTWDQEDPLIKIAVTGLTSGYVLVDDVIWAPMQFFDGGWYLPVGGATPFLFDDKFIFTDSIESDSKIQRAIAELYGLYLPHTTGGTETWADP